MKKIISLLLIATMMLMSLSVFAGCTVKLTSPIENVCIVDNASKFTLNEEVPQTGKGTLRASLAKNEYEGMQFILNFKEDVKTVSVNVSEIVSGNGEKLKVSGVYREHYITGGDEEMYPDALIPLLYEDINRFDIKANENQGIWITVRSETEQQAGTYTGTLNVSYDGGEINIPIEVEVWDFAIPTKPSMETSFELWFGTIWNLMEKNGATTNADFMKTYQQYYWFLSDYRLCSPSIPENYSSPKEFADLVEKYLSDGRIRTYRIPMTKDNYESDGTLKKEHQAYIDELDKRGLLESGFIYTYDEPSTDYYNAIVKSFSATKNHNNKVRNLLTVSPRTSFFDTVDIWCGIWSTDVLNEEFVRDRQAAGDEVWWYGCLNPKNPFPAYHISSNLIGARLVSWMQKDWNITGNLYWASGIMSRYTRETGWNNPRDIWTDPMTIYCHGDGYLLYAGTENDGVINRNLPVPSLRLESIRDGMEDYEYLVLLEKKIQSILDKYEITDVDYDTIMDTYYETLYNTMGDFDTNPDLMIRTRERLAHDIMASDDVIVSVLAKLTEKNSNMREVRIYAPTDANVTIGQESIKGELHGKYSIYSKEYSMNNIADFSTVEIIVNGEKYTRTLKSIEEYEYRDIAYANIKKSYEKLNLPIDYIEVRKAYEANNFDFTKENTGDRFVEGVVANKNLLPMIKSSIGKDYDKSIPLLTMNYNTAIDNKNPERLQQRLELYVPRGASVKVGDIEAEFITSGESYSLYQYIITFNEAGKQPVNISVELNGITENFTRIIDQKTSFQYSLFDLTNEDVISLINTEVKNANVVNVDDTHNAISLNFEQKTAGRISFPSSIFSNGRSDFHNCTHFLFEFTNKTDHLVSLPKILFLTGSAGSESTSLYGLVRPGDTVTAVYEIPPRSRTTNLKGLRFVYSAVDSESFNITNLRMTNMPFYYVGESDYILLD